jgi:hypothetical protein
MNAFWRHAFRYPGAENLHPRGLADRLHHNPKPPGLWSNCGDIIARC